jgi:diacylglycerol kinase
MGILGVMILLVICAEMINTAIEEVVNLLTNEHRLEAKIAKDVSAGMVLLTAIGSAIVGFLVFTPYILKFFK